MDPRFSHIRDWIFDLDNCLYPASTGLFSLPYVPFVTGTHVFRVRIPGDPAHEGADSQTFSVTVKANPGVINPEPAHNGTPPSEGH